MVDNTEWSKESPFRHDGELWVSLRVPGRCTVTLPEDIADEILTNRAIAASVRKTEADHSLGAGSSGVEI